ncbi:ABC transporter permease [Acaryochloris marina]|uniref:ABC transporter permease n=1 Tax=Acaryochloris marina TaxID=155978 RepID=UPI001BAFF39D|nr:ABC transporter permease [Acaryochloris marina]
MNQYHAPKRVIYTPESRIRHPLQMLQEMGRDLLASRELAWRLLVRDISAQYRQSLLGIFWAFMPPVVTAFGLVMARNTGVVNLGETELPYPAYVMFSMALWQTFVEALNGPIMAVNAAKAMLAKINFPREALVLAKLGEVAFNFGIKLILIVGLFVWFQMPVTWAVLLVPVALVHLVMLGTGIGLVLAPLGALYGDVQKVLPMIVAPWLLLTPVIYEVPQSGLFGSIVRLNPVTPLLVTTRELATTGVLTDVIGFWWASGLALGLFLLGWMLYRLAMPFMVERMSS